MAGSFKDHFSIRSPDYARYRPTYPAALFECLAGLAKETRRAWDCATGSGQAAIALADYFDEVIATDASAEQVNAAVARDGVRYRVAPAEGSGLDDNAFDLVSVGQALHWFDRPRFFAEAGRVLVEGGVLAAWCYERCEVTPAIDAVVERLYEDIVGPFWPPERVLIERGYRDIDMPGAALETPDFEMRLTWGPDDMLGYLGTWSACKRYEAQHGEDPVSLIREPLRSAWGSNERPVRWPVRLRVCRL
ncbi:MAG: class I SAM-dependent methyltransferase [Woeseiaceae bacterium]|nr:class I SAM-dependent methyltransferase [Woeseiaceae bacterium]